MSEPSSGVTNADKYRLEHVVVFFHSVKKIYVHA